MLLEYTHEYLQSDWLAQKTILLAQHNQENIQLSPKPFPCERVQGSGDETSYL